MQPAGPLEGKTILVTGAAGQGMGRGIVEALEACGAAVVGMDVSAAAAEELRAAHPQLLSLVGDVSVEADVERVFDEAAALAGPIHGVVNNAGIGLNRPFHEVTAAEFERIHGVDVRGTWLVSRAFASRAISAGRAGAIVNISSVHGTATAPGYAVYAGAKAAVDGMTRGIAVDLGPHRIRCNAVAPGYVHAAQNVELIRCFTDDPEGWIDTHTDDFQLLNHVVGARDCGDTVAFLLSDAARSITGQTLLVDAGLTTALYNNSFTRRTR